MDGAAPAANKSALLRRGFSPALIRELLGAPDRIVVKKRGYVRLEEHLYGGARVGAACRDARFLVAGEGRGARAAAWARSRR